MIQELTELIAFKACDPKRKRMAMKSRTQGAKDKKPRKRRGSYRPLPASLRKPSRGYDPYQDPDSSQFKERQTEAEFTNRVTRVVRRKK